MDIIGQMKTADLYLKVYRGELSRLVAYDFVPQKKEYIPDGDKAGALPRATPESQGVSSNHIVSFLKELSSLKEDNPHSVILLRHGKVITEAHFKPYRGDYPHMLYSLSKTFTATAIGMAVEEGLLSLDDKLIDLFPDKVTPLHNARLNLLTLRHLMMMQSGIKFNELGSIIEKDWIKGFMQSDFSFEPGTRFHYNSMNSYMLSAALQRKAGMGLVDYLTPRLFAPLGIRNVNWETCPQGIEKGGWGLSLRIEDIAKLGQLYLQKGRWTVDGRPRQLLSREWIAQATRDQQNGVPDAPENGYGYQIWMCRDPGSYNFNGIFGQYVIVLPQTDFVVAITSGSQNLTPDSTTLEAVYRFFSSPSLFGSVPLPKDVRALKSLVETMKDLTFMRREVVSRWEHTPANLWSSLKERWLRKRSQEPKLNEQEQLYNGKVYSLHKSYGSLLPLVLQAVHGNFTQGVQKVSFRFFPWCCELTITEGDNVNVISAGTDGEPRYATVNVNGEIYRVGSMARWTTDEDDRDVLKVFISFIETPDTRVFKFIFGEDGLTVKFEEIPSVRMAFQLLDKVLPQEKGGSREYIRHKLDKLIAPKARSLPEETKGSV